MSKFVHGPLREQGEFSHGWSSGGADHLYAVMLKRANGIHAWSINPFTASAGESSGLKEAGASLQTVFWSCYTSAVHAMRFDQKSFHMQRENQNEKAEEFRTISQLSIYNCEIVFRAVLI